MRTTLDLDADILQAVKDIASAKGTTAGRVVSDLVRKALEASGAAQIRNGVPLMPRRGPNAPRITLQFVNELLDEP